MKYSLIYPLLLCLVALSPDSYATQTVAGLQIEYDRTFSQNAPAEAAARRAHQGRIQAVNILNAPGARGLDSVQILQSRWSPGFSANMESGLLEVVRSIGGLDGVTNLSHQVNHTRVSGHRAVRLSLEADRNKGKIGGEALAIYDTATNTTWQVFTLFGKSRGLNPFGSVSVDHQRQVAIDVIDSVRVVGR